MCKKAQGMAVKVEKTIKKFFKGIQKFFKGFFLHNTCLLSFSFVFIFGLLSCTGDKIDLLYKPESKGGETRHDEHTHLVFGLKSATFSGGKTKTQSIEETQHLFIDQSLDLEVTPEPENQDYTTDIFSDCYIDGMYQKTYHHISRGQKKLWVKNLVPLDVFTPTPLLSQNFSSVKKTKTHEAIHGDFGYEKLQPPPTDADGKNQVYCDFDIQLKVSNGKIGSIALNHIQILGLENRYDMDFWNGEYEIHASSIDRDQKFYLPEEIGQHVDFHIFCGLEKKTFYLDGSVIDLKILKEKEILWLDSSNLCRFIVEDRISKKREVGALFRIYNDKPEIELDYRIGPVNFYDRKEGDHLRKYFTFGLYDNEIFYHEPAVQLLIKNTGPTQACVRFKNFTPNMEILYYYMESGLNKSHVSPSEKIQLHWHPPYLIDGNQEPHKLQGWVQDAGEESPQFCPSSNNESSWIQIPPQKTLVKEAYIEESYSCLQYYKVYNLCPYFFKGALVKIPFLPQVELNSFKSMKNLLIEEKSFSIPEKKYANYFNYFLPNTENIRGRNLFCFSFREGWITLNAFPFLWSLKLTEEAKVDKNLNCKKNKIIGHRNSIL